MGTTYTVKVVVSRLAPAEQDEIRRAVAAELADIDQKMSTYRPDSELSRFNRHESTQRFVVSASTLAVFQEALAVHALTDGAFDVTLGPLLEAWGFGPSGRRDREPSAADLVALRAAVGSGLLSLDRSSSSVRKARPDVACDLSGIAPGFAIDRLTELLRARGYNDFLVELGGELRASGTAESRQPWRVAIERPLPAGRSPIRIVPLENLAIATSGDYRNYYEVGGERVSHILDPRTGSPIRHRLASATVLDGRSIRADALSTALMVMGPEDGFAFAERQRLAALLIVRTDGGGFEERATPEFERLVSGARP